MQYIIASDFGRHRGKAPTEATMREKICFSAD